MTAFIKFNRQKSTDFGLRIVNDLEHNSTSYDVETIEVPGRDGILLRDNHRLREVEREFPMKLSSGGKRLTEVATDISDWLNVKGWQEMELSWDPDYIYLATFIETFSIKELIKNFGEIKLNFMFHPIKFLKSGRDEIRLTNGILLKNIGNVEAKPIVKLVGNGSGMLTINGYQLGLENVQGGLIIDMQKHLVYSGNLSAWDKIIRTERHRMPIFDVGDNRISWTGNFEISVVPNWGVKI